MSAGPAPVKRNRPIAAAWLAAALLAGTAGADDSALPPVQHSGDISYVSGGVGEEESNAIKAAAPHYALWLSFIARIEGKDAYSAPEQLTIFKADGTPVLDLKPNGPFLLIDLPPGRYRVSAGSAASSKTLPVEIRRGSHQRLVFQVPEGAQ